MKPMFLISLLTNKDLFNTQIIQCANDTIFRKRFRLPGFGTGSYLKSLVWMQVNLITSVFLVSAFGIVNANIVTFDVDVLQQQRINVCIQHIRFSTIR